MRVCICHLRENDMRTWFVSTFLFVLFLFLIKSKMLKNLQTGQFFLKICESRYLFVFIIKKEFISRLWLLNIVVEKKKKKQKIFKSFSQELK